MRKLKRFLSIILSVLLSIIFCCSCQAVENTESNFVLTMEIGNPIMTVNGTEQNIDESGTSPVIQNGRTLVPVRSIIEAMGGKAEWDQSAQTAALTYNNDTINLIIGSTRAYFNNEENTLDTAPVIINNRTMLFVL
ncbi:MAG: copper amine oxidase N-terminal domain-containing protein [Clostridia bacterium]|nr:copper amine oxidase N-terminal domain-containing protein [Clostridia bacterium]